MSFARSTVAAVLLVLAANSLCAAQKPALSFDELKARAEVARSNNQVEEQVKLYHRLVSLRPEWGEGWWYFGTGLYDLHRYEEALTAFQHLSKIDGQDGSSWALMGMSEFELKRYEDSLKHLFRAEELGVGANQEMLLTVRYHIAILLNRAGQFEWAHDHLTAFSWLADTSDPIVEAVGINALRMPVLPSELPAEKLDLVMQVGRASWEPSLAGHPEQAIKTFEDLVAKYPDEPNLHYAYGARLLDSDPAAAEREFQKEVKINPTQVVARIQIVFLKLKQGDSEDAVSLARDAVKIAPDYFLAHNALGRSLLADGKTADAIQELQKAVQLEPKVPESHFDLAEAYRAAGRKLDAQKETAEFARIKSLREHLNGAPLTPQ